MPFDDFMTDKVSILKKNGDKIESVGASVQPPTIFINRGDILIEYGDLVQRTMSNGGEETFEVVDPGFKERFGGFDAHYQMQVRTLGIPEAIEAVKSINVHVSGNYARINTNSIDNSTNIYDSIEDLREHITALRSEIERIGSPDDLEIVDAIDKAYPVVPGCAGVRLVRAA